MQAWQQAQPQAAVASSETMALSVISDTLNVLFAFHVCAVITTTANPTRTSHNCHQVTKECLP